MDIKEREDIQQLFLNKIKGQIDKSISFVDELAEILSISKDSAYRRLRGETQLNLEEIHLLSTKFNISLDTLLNTTPNSVSFDFRSMHPENLPLKMWLQSVLGNLQMIAKLEIKELFYAAKDVPMFHLFQYPELSAFKVFFWSRTVLQFPEYQNKKLDADSVDPEIIQVCNNIYEAFVRVPSVEIWSTETIELTIGQITYFWDCGLFATKEYALEVCNAVVRMIDNIESQAKHGFKYLPGKEPVGKSDNLKLYLNEVAVSDNTIFFNMGGANVAFITHNMLNLLTTSDPAFCQSTFEHLQNQIRQSALISVVSEKERNKLFRHIKGRLAAMIKKIEEE